MEKQNIHWDSSLYQEKHNFVYKYGEQLIGLLNPQAGENILDLGCGNGHLANEIAKSGALITGVDSSENMVLAAKASYPEINFLVEDAVSMRYVNAYDAVFSNAVMHWITDPIKAAVNVHASLKQGGRFVAEFGGKGNNDGLLQALKLSLMEYNFTAQARINFWYFPSLADYVSMLETIGLIVTFAHTFARPTRLDDPQNGVKDWFRMFGEKFFAAMDKASTEKVLDRTQELLSATHFKDGHWYADYVRLRIVARKV